MSVTSFARKSGEKTRVLTDAEVNMVGGAGWKRTEQRVCGIGPTQQIDPAGLDYDF